jgi:ketosteroid isomerase-like protein
MHAPLAARARTGAAAWLVWDYLCMMDREGMEQLLAALYAARIGGQLDQLCGLFSTDAYLRISGASDGKPIAVDARGAVAIRGWLGVMVKTFKLSNHGILAMLIDGEGSAVHWCADIHSRITGSSVRTELVDLIQIRDDLIVSYREFFVPVKMQ